MMDKYNINNPDWARGLNRAVKVLNYLYGIKEVKKRIMPKWNECLTDEGVISIKDKEEVKKLNRPYLGIKIVKVKKKEQREVVKYRGKKYIITRNMLNGVTYLDEYKGKPKGNWINGENLDKIKFPVLCRFNHFKDGIQGVHGIGIINKTFGGEQIEYELVRVDYQQKDINVLCSIPSLKTLIELYDIHILKGKIILYEEE